MNQRQKAVLFDLDGTLVNTIADIDAALNAALATISVAPLSNDECMSVVGGGLRNAVRHALKKRGVAKTEEEIEELYHRLMAYYRLHPADRSRPYDGILPLLSRLSCPYGILSNKADELIQVIVKQLFPGVPFSFVMGMKDSIPRKPDKAGVVLFSKACGLPLEDIIVIGDSEVDWQLAKNAGSPSVLVSWGFRPTAELKKLEGTSLCATMEELEKTIDAI